MNKLHSRRRMRAVRLGFLFPGLLLLAACGGGGGGGGTPPTTVGKALIWGTGTWGTNEWAAAAAPAQLEGDTVSSSSASNTLESDR